MDRELANYIANYVIEELVTIKQVPTPSRALLRTMLTNNLDAQMILDAVDAYEGGAR